MSVNLKILLYFFIFLPLHVCGLSQGFLLFFLTAGSALCDSEGERPGVQGALQDGEGVPQGRV